MRLTPANASSATRRPIDRILEMTGILNVWFGMVWKVRDVVRFFVRRNGEGPGDDFG